MIRVVAGLVPVAVICLMWQATRWSALVPAGEIVRLTRGRSFEGLPSLSPDGEWVAYRSDASGHGDIALSSVDGRQTINLTASSLDDETDPAFSPDGAQIAFASAKAGLFLIAREGGEVRHLARSGFNPAWTPDGRFIIYATTSDSSSDFRAGVSEGWKVELSTGVTSRVSLGDFHQPSVSPHSRRIAYWARPVDRFDRRRVTGARGYVWTMPLEGGVGVRVTSDAANETSPVWSPDGRFLYFISNRAGSSAIWRVRIDERTGRTRGKPVLVPTPLSQPEHLTRSADGRRYAWSDATPIQQVMRIAFDADARMTRGAPVEITAHDATPERAAPSPEGSSFAPSSQGPVLVDAPPTAPQGAPFPGNWSPDRKLFAGTAAGAVWIYSAEARTYEQLRLGANPVWLNDSRRLIYAYGGRLFLADVSWKISRELLALPDQDLDAPRLSRDNLHLYFTRGSTDANLWLMTVDSSAR